MSPQSYKCIYGREPYDLGAGRVHLPAQLTLQWMLSLTFSDWLYTIILRILEDDHFPP